MKQSARVGKPRTKLTARIDTDVLAKVAKLAKDEDCSLSNKVERILAKAVEDK